LSLARSANLVRQPANPIAHTVKMPDNGRVRRPNPLVFEKSRLDREGVMQDYPLGGHWDGAVITWIVSPTVRARLR